MSDLESYLQFEVVLRSFLSRMGLLACARCFRHLEKEPPHIVHTWGEFLAKIECRVPVPKEEWDEYVNSPEGFIRGVWVAFLVYFNRWADGKDVPTDMEDVGVWFLAKKMRHATQGHLMIHETLIASDDIRMMLSCLLVGFANEERYPLAHPPSHPEIQRALLIEESEGVRGLPPKLWVRRMLGLFYRHVRPALMRMYEARDQPWFKFGPEVYRDLVWGQDVEYPKASFTVASDGRYAVEVDRVPFTDPRNAIPELWVQRSENWGLWTCAEHNPGGTWNRIRGFIPVRDYYRKGGKILPPTKLRDHPYIVTPITQKDWTFLHKVAGPGWLDTVKPHVEGMLNAGLYLSSDAVACLLFKAVGTMLDRFRVYNHWV